MASEKAWMRSLDKLAQSTYIPSGCWCRRSLQGSIARRPPMAKRVAGIAGLALFILFLAGATAQAVGAAPPLRPDTETDQWTAAAAVAAPGPRPLSYNVTATIPVGTYPIRAVMTPNGQEVYVTNMSSNNVSVISTATNTVTNTVLVGTNPYALAAHPDGSKIYVGCMGGDVYVISTTTKAASVISVGSPVNDLAISNSGDRLYLAMEFSGLKKVVTATSAGLKHALRALHAAVVVLWAGRVEHKAVHGHRIVVKLGGLLGYWIGSSTAVRRNRSRLRACSRAFNLFLRRR